ncbi:uncharacterized protein LOC124645365 [Helicoverpa zea]|uniref:uncharacterized protein LOC124645365 n=1 Tax=Helicoverpa zea TaxID=7113 RepID=UPI001F55B159|nr:uncharacterized protein LOC124645365 [Helicoverpa zea]
MDDELKELKSLLRSLVVSSRTQMDVRTLMRDFRNMVGSPMPLAKYGHTDPVAFLKEHFDDCFEMTGPSSNPVLTLIVPGTLKYFDQLVRRQKVSSTAKFHSNPMRGSIPESAVNKQNPILKTFVKDTQAVLKEPEPSVVEAPDVVADASHNKQNVVNHQVTSIDFRNSLQKRLALYKRLRKEEEEPSSEREVTISPCQDDDSGNHTSSSSNDTRALQLEELKSEIMELIRAAPRGLWCTDLIRLYRNRFNREMNFTRFGYMSLIEVVSTMVAGVVITRPEVDGDWYLQPRGAGPLPPPRRPARASPPPDPDDALPGIDYDADVFPADCLHFTESIPAQSLNDVLPGAMVEVTVSEVYSPSHFWLIRLGNQYHIAMDNMMDAMTEYYNGEGRERWLARNAVRVGQYCSSLYEGDWHRSLIVKILDSDTVKVRHVDYGTVDKVAVNALRPLRREYARLPAQAVRARLAGLRPCAGGQRWPPSAAVAFLRLVTDTPLVANIVAVDREADIIETLLIETSTAVDRNLSAELIRAGHADERPDSALRSAECYLKPSFEALETGATPNLGEIHEYLRDGILLDCVAAYRQHVLACVPPSDSSASDHPPYASLPPPSSPTELSSPQVTSQRPLCPPAAPLALSPKHSGPSEAKAQRQTECRPQSIVHPQLAGPHAPPGMVSPAQPGPYMPRGVVSPAQPGPYMPRGVVSPAQRGPYGQPGAVAPAQPGQRGPYGPQGAVALAQPGPYRPPGVVSPAQPGPYRPPGVVSPAQPGPYRPPGLVSSAQPGPYGPPGEVAPAQPGPYGPPGEVAPAQPGTYGPPGEMAPAQPGPYGPPGEVAPAQPGTYGPPGEMAPAQPGPYGPPGEVAPAQPGPYAPPGVVTLSRAECDKYFRLLYVNPMAAHWYMARVLDFAMRRCSHSHHPGFNNNN